MLVYSQSCLSIGDFTETRKCLSKIELQINEQSKCNKEQFNEIMIKIDKKSSSASLDPSDLALEGNNLIFVLIIVN